MKVSVNGQEVEIFRGARVRDVLRLYSAQEMSEVEKGTKRICDRWGNVVGLDGELSGGEELYLR